MTDLLTLVCSYYCKAYSELSTEFVHLGVLDMKKILIAIAVLLSFNAFADANFYNEYGQSTGRIDSNGGVYNQYGQSQGRIDSNGGVYNQYGQSQGRVDANGNIYNQYGQSKGRIGR